MFDDPKRELQRLERQLLEDDNEIDHALAQARMLLDGEDEAYNEDEAFYREFTQNRRQPSGYGNTDRVDVNLEQYSDEVFEDEPRERGLRGLTILACLELLGIAAIAVYWLVQLL